VEKCEAIPQFSTIRAVEYESREICKSLKINNKVKIFKKLTVWHDFGTN